MQIADYVIFSLYMLGVLGIGVYFFRKNSTAADYYVGGRSISSAHVGLSIVATDVGGGFSIGLGGLGYLMGLSGSWLLFHRTARRLVSAVWIIPKIKRVDKKHGMLTYPDFLRLKYDTSVALTAAVISAIGYLGFYRRPGPRRRQTDGCGAIIDDPILGLSPLSFSLYIIGAIIIGYTVMGGSRR